MRWEHRHFPLSSRAVASILGLLVALSAADVLAKGLTSKRLERQFFKAGKVLTQVRYRCSDRDAARLLRLNEDTLKQHALYLRAPKPSREFIYIDSDGWLHRDGQNKRRASRISLVLTRQRATLFVDGKREDGNLLDWQLIWVGNRAGKPEAITESFPHRQVADGFMRVDLLTNSEWQVKQGDWRLRQHGGGMPLDKHQAVNAGFRRAVNPFTVRGSKNGILTYGTTAWLHGHIEARFYFGIPRDANTISFNDLPKSDLMVGHGDLNGMHVMFGWSVAEKDFVLRVHDLDGSQTTLARWQGPRPPITNWVKIGLTLEDGHRLTGWLDGVEAVVAEMEQPIVGPVHLFCGKAVAELDDVRAHTLPRDVPDGAPVIVRSRFFADKKVKDKSDPAQFAEWAKASNAFVLSETAMPEYSFPPATDSNGLAMTTAAKGVVALLRAPLMGDFRYESVPHDDRLGALPPGRYELRLYRRHAQTPFALAKAEVVFRLLLRYEEGAWHAEGDETSALGLNLPVRTLRLERKAADGHRLVIIDGAGARQPISEPLQGTIHLGIVRLQRANAATVFPAAAHHRVYADNVVNELFEEAPTDWSWIEGAFRMDSRWACQNEWNFMACGGVGLPYMVSKRTFAGDQEHEYYMSLRPVYPWDIGDSDFSYDPTKDKGWKIFVAHEGWYVRRDLNFSFCTDGRNPLSGYSVLFGTHDNETTQLLRKGVVVAENDNFLFPKVKAHTSIHWNWWNFDVRRHGARVQVHLNGTMMFDYVDPSPIAGGHIGFWSVRNGFTVSRVSSVAERIGIAPHVLYVANDTPSPWQPLLTDNVQVMTQAGPWHTKVKANVGGGFLAVRYSPKESVDLTAQPVLALPIRLGGQSKVNLHLHTATGSYLLALSAPTEASKSLLTPDFELGEQFRRATIDFDETKDALAYLGTAPVVNDWVTVDLAARLRQIGVPVSELCSLTVGNTSNQRNLLAGHGGNQAGSHYELGSPEFRPASQ